MVEARSRLLERPDGKDIDGVYRRLSNLISRGMENKQCLARKFNIVAEVGHIILISHDIAIEAQQEFTANMSDESTSTYGHANAEFSNYFGYASLVYSDSPDFFT